MKNANFDKRIVVIDDDLAIRVLLEAVLRRLGYEVALAEDGQAGLALIRKSECHLVLLDLMMPNLNGYEFLEQFHAGGISKAHIIVFTAAGQRGVARIPTNYVCASIQKPFDLETFVQLVGTCMEGQHGTLSSPSAS